MPFDGYLALGGTEIINAQRTAAYVRNLVPMLSLHPGCCDCESLDAFLGDAPYSSPLQDEPPWFSPFRTESADFLGLVPLALEGFEDSTRQVAITEVTGDGAVSGRPRRASRDVRVQALMVATTEKGLELGMSWLRDALAGSGCAEGDCSGDDLCYLAACPQVCDDPLTVDVLDVDFRFMPLADRLEEVARWESSSGTITTATVSGKGTLRANGLVGQSSVSRTIDGLTPGAVYRVTADLLNGADTGSATYVDLSVAGSSYRVTSPVLYGPTGAPDTSGAVLEFVATSETHRIVITPRGTVTSPTNAPVRIYLTGLSVIRMPQRSILISGTVNAANPEALYSWTPATPGGYTTFWDATPGGITYTAVGAQTPAIHTLGLHRTLQNLMPGKKYRVRLGVRAVRTGTTTPSLFTLGVNTTEGAWDDTVGAANWTGSTVGDVAWVTYPFTAADTTTILRVRNGVAMTMASGATLDVQIFYVRVEQVLDDEEIEPVIDPSRPLRTLRQAVTTSGPVVSEVYPPRAAHLQKVEWTMNANSPRPVGEPIVVTETLGMGSVTVPEVECYNGQQVITNGIANPSFESNLTGWSSSGTNWGALTRVADALATHGSFVARATATATATSPLVASYSLTGLTPGSAYTVAIDSGASVANVAVSLRVQGPTWSAVSPQVVLSAGAAGVTSSLTFYVPPNAATTATFTVSMISLSTGVATGGYVWIDSASMTNTAYRTPYVDGTVTGGSWNGTANNSTSVWRNPITPTIIDPDCPPPPAPPRPPLVLNDCVLPSDLWLRYSVAVPAEVTQAGTTGFPAVTMTTGATAARGVRARMYPNPFGIAADQVDPCTYCGEFLLSYLPPNAALTVDASLRDAWITVNGQRQTAMPLLYGTDGGPMTWPEMDCGVPYLLTVDLDADAPPLIGLGLDVIPGF